MKDRERTLIKNTIIILICKFFTQFLSIIFLPFLTSILSTQEYGTFDLITSYAWVITGFISLQVENGIFRFLIDKREDKNEISSIITNGIIAIFITGIIFTCIYIPLFYLIKFDNYIYIYLYAISTLFLNIPLQISRGLGDNQTYAVASIISGVLNIVMSCFSLYALHIGMMGLVISAILANVIGGIYIFLRKKLYRYIFIKKTEKSTIKNLLKYSIPLLPNSISSWIMNISDRVMISIIIDNSATGIYSIATKFPVVLTNFYNVFNLSWSESASINVNSEDKEKFFSNAINKIFTICSCITLVIMSMMPVIFKIMIDSKFIEAYEFVPILMLALIFELVSILLGGVYIALKLSNNIAITTFVASMVNVLINLFFLKKFGIIIACISTLVSYLILVLIRLINLGKYIKLKLNIKIFLTILLLFFIILPFYYCKTIFSCLIMIIVSLLALIVLNKSIIISYLNELKGYLIVIKKEKSKD